jgi:imidazolonepropionase-like amidohydrolase
MNVTGLLLSVLLIRNVTVISPVRTTPHVSVLVRDDKIAAIGARIEAPAGAQIIDGTGKFLIPGLIDSHVHAGAPGPLDEDALTKHPELLDAYRSQLPRAFLAFGFTTLVDLDLRPGTLTWFNATPLHPQLFHCGPAVRTSGGYGSHIKDANIADTSDAVPRAIDRVVQSGAICVKTFVEPGFGGARNWPVPTPATLAAIRREASKHGLVMIVHANDVNAWRSVMDAHADVIAHGLWHWPGDRRSDSPPAVAREVIGAAARARIGVQPTLQSVYGDLSIFDDSMLADPRLAIALPPSVLAYLKSDEGRAAQRAIQDEYRPMIAKLFGPGDPQEIMRIPTKRASATLRIMSSDGVKLLFGSDTPANEGFGNPPGLNGRLEISRWAEAGVSPARVLRAATIDNAIAFHLTDRGEIAPGKRADLVLLDADPMKSTDAYDAIDTIIVGGVPAARATLTGR